jgi:hypothetical protein
MIFIANAIMLCFAGFFWERSGLANKLIIFVLITLAALNASAASAIIKIYLDHP